MNESPAASDPAPPDASAPAPLALALPAGLVLLLALALASFPARNSDVWRHLATGRALLDGEYALGTDPFAYTTQGVAWVNHAWLYDVLLYVVYRAAGDFLVVVSALLAVALAGFLLRAARPSAGIGVAAIATAIALVAIGPHLVLGPAVLSYVLFAFTLWWLERDRQGESLRAHVPLFLAFILWASGDEWFILGPIAVGLFWLGTALAPRPDDRTPWPAVFALAMVVCVLNPHHVRVFWPSLLALTQGTEAGGRQLLQLLSTPPARLPPPLVAYALLVVLALLSLLVPGPRSWPRLVVVLALLGLSLYHAAAIPFFAIACAPWIARRGQAATARAVPDDRTWLGPLAATVVVGALVVLACPGWLQSAAAPRSWRLHADPSLRAVAQQLAEERRTGQLGADARGFNLSVDAAHYLEWFCPGEKVFLDSRTNLFPSAVAADFTQVRQALAGEGEPQADTDVGDILRHWAVTHVVVADPADRALNAALRRLWRAPGQWELIALEGRAAVFARPHLGPPSLHLAGRAFDPAAVLTAPDRWPGREPEPREWWDCFGGDQSAGALDRDEALVDLMHFGALRPAYLEKNRMLWEASAVASVLGAAAPPQAAGVLALGSGPRLALFVASRQPVPPAGPSPLDLLVLQSISAHMQRCDDGPPAALLLAVRAARRALHDDPDDALAYLRLGWAYERLHHHTAERVPGFARLTQLRLVQAITALQNALRLRPDLVAAHELLVRLYLEAEARDLALPHLQAQLNLSRLAGPRPGESPAQFTARIESMAGRETNLGKQVRELLNLVDTQAFDRDVFSKASLAKSRGLPGRALAVLLASSYEAFGRDGAILQYHLLLLAGRTAEVRDWMDPDQEVVMGVANYRWLHALLGAATGDYEPAAEDLGRMVVPAVAVPELAVRAAPPRAALALLLGQHLLRGASLDPWQMRERPETLLPRLAGLAQAPREHADLLTLRGLLALEVGRIAPARAAFTAARATWSGPDGSATVARHALTLLPEQ